MRWHGEPAKDGFVRFGCLAATPGEEGDLTWKVVQRYDDGEDVAWIGPPGTDRPAAVTRISAAVAPQNAGGEGSGRATSSGPAPAAVRPSRPDEAPGDDRWALMLGTGGLLLGVIALGVALRRRPAEIREESAASAEAW